MLNFIDHANIRDRVKQTMRQCEMQWKQAQAPALNQVPTGTSIPTGCGMHTYVCWLTFQAKFATQQLQEACCTASRFRNKIQLCNV